MQGVRLENFRASHGKSTNFLYADAILGEETVHIGYDRDCKKAFVVGYCDIEPKRIEELLSYAEKALPYIEAPEMEVEFF